jgi:hypothetical protein
MANGNNFAYRPRIYIHAPYEPELQQVVEAKRGILKKIQDIGFDPQEFGISGVPKGDPWSFGRAIEVMRQCDGALTWRLGAGWAQMAQGRCQCHRNIAISRERLPYPVIFPVWS